MPTFEDQASITNNVEGLCGEIWVVLTADHYPNQYDAPTEYSFAEVAGWTWVT